MTLYRRLEDPAEALRFKLIRRDQPVLLSDALPVLENMGLKVLSEEPSEIEAADGRRFWLHDFGLQPMAGGAVEVDAVRESFQDLFSGVWAGRLESDGFNRLVLAAGLSPRQIVTLRSYCRYILQIGTPFSQAYIEQTLAANPGIAHDLAALFDARFDPALQATSTELQAGIEARIGEQLNEVASLDQDRILRRYLELIKATLRTNAWQAGSDGRPKDYVSYKFDPSRIPGLPAPRPVFEIFVYAPYVEGVHLRGGKVARGGLRWSDRREDFRTEILGLMKAQMVKNAVIVPVGAKGGFVREAPAAGHRPGGVHGRGRALLQGVPARPARHHRQPGPGRHRPAARRGPLRRRRSLPGGRRRQGHGHLLRLRQRGQPRVRLLARRRLRVGRLGRLRPQEDGHHRQGCLGIGQAALPRAGPRHPDPALHRGRHRRHVGRRVRQRHAAVRADPAGGGLRPPPHLPRPRSGSGDLLRRAPADVRPAALQLGRLRPRPDQPGRRGVAAQRQGDRPVAGGPPRPGDRGRDRQPERADERDPQGTGRPVLERRHRHLRQGHEREPGRGPGPAQRRHPGQRLRAALPRRRRGRQSRLHPEGPGRVRAPGRPDQHRLHRQLGRRRLLGPRGQHQDPPARGARRRRAHHEAARRAAGLDDRRGGRARPARQRAAEPGLEHDRGHRSRAPGRAAAADAAARGRRAARSGGRGSAERRRGRRAPQAGQGPDPAGARGPAVLRQDDALLGPAAHRSARSGPTACST